MQGPWVWDEEWGCWKWNDQWWNGNAQMGYYVWHDVRRWCKPEWWGGLGCSCNVGRCCRMCPHGYQFRPGLCFWCGNNECCRWWSNCGHPCCQQVSPKHVVKRLQEVLSKGDVLGGVLGPNMLLKIAEFIITYPSDD